MKNSLSILVLVAAAAAAAGAQQIPSSPQYNDEQSWAIQLQKEIPAGELAAALSAESTGQPDPLTTLAVQYGVTEPDWLKQRIAAQKKGSTVLAALGDSITAGMASCSFPYYYCPDNSWSTGSLPTSVLSELSTQSGRDVRYFLVAVPGVTMSFMPAEAYAVFLASMFGLNVQRMTLFIGHNDPGVCGAPNDHETQDFGDSYASTLRILGHVAQKRGARLYVGSITEVPVLARYANVVPTGTRKTCSQLWQETNRCAPVTQHAGDPAALAAVSAQIATYDDMLDRLAQGKDWVRYVDIFNASSRLGLTDPAAELSKYDCFHPSASGQGVLGRLAWDGFDGTAGISDFFAFPNAASPAPRSAPELAPSIAAELDAWNANSSRP